jgi:hypothetical protein
MRCCGGTGIAVDTVRLRHVVRCDDSVVRAAPGSAARTSSSPPRPRYTPRAIRLAAA